MEMYNKLVVFKNKKEFNQRNNKSINGISKNYLATYAEVNKIDEEAALLSLKIQNTNNRGCWDCIGCMGCVDCSGCVDCAICQNSFCCYRCGSCYNCVLCDECYKIKYCKGCKGAQNCIKQDYCVNKDNISLFRNKNK